MAQSPIRRPVSQVEDFKARFGVVQGQRGHDSRHAESANHGASGGGFSSRQILAAIVLAMVAGMSGAAAFWFAQDLGGQQQTAGKTAVSTPQKASGQQPAAARPAASQSSSLQKSSDADSPVLASGGTEEIASPEAAPAGKSIANPLPQPQAAQVAPPVETLPELEPEPAPQQPPAAESPALQQAAKAPEAAIAEPEAAASPANAAQPEQEPAAAPVAQAPQPESEAPPPVESNEEQVALAAPQPEAAAEPVPAIVPGQVWTDCEGCPELVAVIAPKPNAGGMKFAAENETSGLQPFAIGRFEITFDGWARCVAAGACAEMPSDGGWGAGTRPVINVSHSMITEQYLPWLSNITGKAYRLPTSQEWDIAEAGGVAGVNRGASVGTAQALCESANFAAASACDDPFPETAPVGSYRPNAIGLQDMRGNVWEWVSDCWTPGFNYKAKPSERDCRKRLVRGGSWSSQPALSAVAPKGFEDQTRASRSIGFRVARNLP